MFLELSEVLACPRCGPPQGVIVLVDELEERRVIEGRLDCPNCESRFPICAGVISFQDTKSPAGIEGPLTGVDTPRTERAVEIAALLGLQHTGGYIVLGHGLAPLAGALGELIPDSEFFLLVADQASAPHEQARSVSVATGVRHEKPPLLPGRFAGAGLAAAPVGACLAAYRALRPGAHLAVLDPVPGTLDALSKVGANPLVAEQRALVVRKGG